MKPASVRAFLAISPRTYDSVNFLEPTATWARKGMRLLGMPEGSSPIVPDSCAPTGLKYRSTVIRQSGGVSQTNARMAMTMRSYCQVARS